MKAQEIQSFKQLYQYINTHRYFTHLKPCEHRKQSYTAQLNFAGYADVIFTVMDILKVSVLALEADEPYGSTQIVDSKVNVRNLLEIALQLVPLEEMQLLDEIHERYQQNKQREKENTQGEQGKGMDSV